MANNNKKKPIKGLIIWSVINVFGAIIYLAIGFEWNFILTAYIVIPVIVICERIGQNKEYERRENKGYSDKPPVLDIVELPSRASNINIANSDVQLSEIFASGENIRQQVAQGLVDIKPNKVNIDEADNPILKMIKRYDIHNKAKIQTSSADSEMLSYSDIFSNRAKSISFEPRFSRIDGVANSSVLRFMRYDMPKKDYKNIYLNLNENKVSGNVNPPNSKEYSPLKRRGGELARQPARDINNIGTGGSNLLDDITRFDNPAPEVNLDAELNIFGSINEKKIDVFGEEYANKKVDVFGKSYSSVHADATTEGFMEGFNASETNPLKRKQQFTSCLAAADNGDSLAKFNTAVCYETGFGIEIDKLTAVKWYRAAAADGIAKADNNLGVMYDRGDGILLDKIKAAQCYLRAANGGNVSAMFNLANKYFSGEGMPLDVTKGLEWLIKSGKGGCLKAANSLGARYLKGLELPKNEEAAYQWFMTAALGGHPYGMYNFALILLNEKSAYFNKNEAKYWLNKASASGVSQASAQLSKL